MMTPSQLKEYEFKTAGRNAYKADDVDDFFAEVPGEIIHKIADPFDFI